MMRIYNRHQKEEIGESSIKSSQNVFQIICIFRTFQTNMRNTLQLDLTESIKKANHFYRRHDYMTALEEYDKCIEVYEQYRKQNSFVTQNYLVTAYSLRGVLLSQLQRNSEAEESFDKSLKAYPHHSPTLRRRAKFFIKNNRLMEAFEDLEKVLIYEPENSENGELLKQIQKKISEMNDDEEKKRLLEYQKNLQLENEVDLNENESLSFLSLKKIDKVIRNSITRPKKKKCSFLKNNQVLSGQSSPSKENSQTQNTQNLTPSKRTSILKYPSIFSQLASNCKISENEVQFEENEDSILDVDSVKNIDGKILSKKDSDSSQKYVSFSINECTYDEENKYFEEKPRKKGKRSILRRNSKFNSEAFSNSRFSSFSNLRNIDKIYKPEESQEEKEMKNKQNEELLSHLQNLAELSRNGNGRSILKKNSLIIPATQQIKQRKYEKKKSVCFT